MRLLALLCWLLSASWARAARSPTLGVRLQATSVSVVEGALAVAVGLSPARKADKEGTLQERFGITTYDAVTNLASLLASPSTANETQRNLPVQSALSKMTRDMELLDDVAGRTPQLTRLELIMLMSTVVVSAASPLLLPINLVEVLVPSMAALSAAVGISAEYVGKVAVSNGKEIAALAAQAAAEAEAILAQAERAKAILPLCVGIATTASAFALLIPTLTTELVEKMSFTVWEEVFLICPLVAVLGASIAGLASQETINLSSRAAGVGNRRFASSTVVGVTWQSQTEQVEGASLKATKKWSTFAYGVLPAPILAAFFPGALPFKSVVCAAVAAAQAAYYLSTAEYAIAEATDAVSLKARTASVADTYANQGSRAGAVLPFTSALGGLCAAASAACVEVLPLVPLWELQSLIAVIFPMGSAMFAAAAAVSKARCEVDAAAASAAAATGLSQSAKSRDPKKVVFELIRCTLDTTRTRIIGFLKRTRSLVRRRWQRRPSVFGGRGNSGEIYQRQQSRAILTACPYYLNKGER